MHWKLKAAAFRALSSLPFGERLHYLLQRRVTRQWPRRADALDSLLLSAKRIRSTARGTGNHFLEIGAGRDLAVAVGLRLLGVPRITCVDVSRLARPELIAHAARHMAGRLGVPAPEIADWAGLERFGISYVAPSSLPDARLDPASVDCFYSIDTLEHIPPGELREVLRVAKGLLKPAGLGVHAIDYSDHYARGQDKLSRFNFLTFSDRAWQPFNSRFHYVNRMRHSEYLDLLGELGLMQVDVSTDVVPAQKSIVDRLAPQFRSFDVADLFTVRSFVVFSAGAPR
ncbi:MAG TPA: class I SAM-dependent methyltransferase [Ramlibacter sp.]|jgi:hypothetical protein